MSYLTAGYIAQYGIICTNESSRFECKNRKNIAVYVGTFDPPHLGHQSVVISLLNMASIDGVLIVPAYNQSCKSNISDFDHRVEMLQLVFRNITNVYISPVEKELVQHFGIQQNKTHITMKRLIELYTDMDFSLAMGTDLFNSFSKWENTDYYINKNVIVINREDYPLDKENLQKVKELITTRITFIGKNMMFSNVSSTYIKKCIFDGDNSKLNGIVDSHIMQYIKEHSQLLHTYNKSYLSAQLDSKYEECEEYEEYESSYTIKKYVDKIINMFSNMLP